MRYYLGIIFGTVAFLMLFVIPFFIPEKYANDNMIVTIYFIVFLILIALGNIFMGSNNQQKEKSVDEFNNIETNPLKY